jgi:hypothetical protein
MATLLDLASYLVIALAVIAGLMVWRDKRAGRG